MPKGKQIAAIACLTLATWCPTAFGDRPTEQTLEAIRGLSGPLVVSDAWPECTDLATWTHDIMRLEGVEDASETEQAKVFFRWLRLFSKMPTGGMHQAYEGNYGDEKYVLDAHKNLFVYGWGYCDTHSRIAEAAWTEYKQTAGRVQRVVTQHENGGYHTMYSLLLDDKSGTGHWGAFDARYGYYLIEKDAPDARILDWDEVGVDANITNNKTYKHRSKPYFEFFGREWDRAFLIQPKSYKDYEAWQADGATKECVFGDSQYELGTPYHDMSFRIPRGTTITRYWDNRKNAVYVPKKNVGEKFLPSGRFYRVTDKMFDGNWVQHDPNYAKCEPYLVTVPDDQGYPDVMHGGRTIGQACGEINYAPQWDQFSDIESAGLHTDMVLSKEAPYLRPREATGAGEVLLDFYCPYVLVDGTLSGQWTASAEDRPTIQIRTLRPKRGTRRDSDQWSEWQTLQTDPGKFQMELGHQRFNGTDVSVHGKYRFQLRLSLQANAKRQDVVGLSELNLNLTFENGIMSIPRLQAGPNVIRFKVQDASAIQGPIKVVYSYQNGEGPQSHAQTLQPSDFADNEAQYTLDAGELVRCDSLLIQYD